MTPQAFPDLFELRAGAVEDAIDDVEHLQPQGGACKVCGHRGPALAGPHRFQHRPLGVGRAPGMRLPPGSFRCPVSPRAVNGPRGSPRNCGRRGSCSCQGALRVPVAAARAGQQRGPAPPATCLARRSRGRVDSMTAPGRPPPPPGRPPEKGVVSLTARITSESRSIRFTTISVLSF